MDVETAFIELPGEANPLNRDGLVRNLALGAGRSAGTQDLQTATKQLQEWESQSEFYVQLQSVFVDQGLPFEVRYLAILQLLNAVTNKHAWGRTSTQGVNRSDKAKIRSQLLVSSYQEPDDRLARQNGLLIAKVVRSDYPREWPSFFDDINATISGDFDHQNPMHLLQLRRALEILQYTVKELATATLKVSILRSKAPELLPSLVRVFSSCTSRFLSHGSGDSFSIDDANAVGLLLPTTSIIRRLVSKGYQHPHRESASVQAWEAVQEFWAHRVQLEYPAGNGEPSTIRRTFEKSILQIAKLQLDIAEDNPAACLLFSHSWQVPIEYLKIVQRFAQSYGAETTENIKVGTDGDAAENETPFMERLALKGILIIRACLRALSDGAALKVRVDQDKAEKEEVIRILQEKIFVPGFVNRALEMIINRFFVFRSNDLRRWEEEPDEWEASEGADTEGYRYSIRLSAEKLFLDLVYKFTEAIVPTVIGLVHTATNTPVGVLQKESVYTALGLAADKIFVYYEKHEPRYNFDQTIPALVTDLQNQDPSYRLIRRRIAILLGKWIHIQISKQNRYMVYQIFLHLLDRDDTLNDLVVRVTAGRQLKEVVGDWEFDAEPFLQFAPDILSRVMNLIAEVELPETKMALLETVSILVENLGTHIAPFADHIVSILPELWDETGEETLRKQVIVTLLVNLFNSMGPASKQYQSFALFIVKAVLRSDSSLPQLERMALLPDALELWKALLENTPNISTDQLHPDLLELLKACLIPTLGLDSEARRAALEITSSYFLLIPKEFLSEQSFVVELLGTQAQDLRSLRPDASAQVFEVVEQLVRAADNLAGVGGVQTVARAMVDAGFFRELLLGLRESYEAHQTTGPKAKVSNIQGQIETSFFSILARILYTSPELFVELVQGTSGSDVDATMGWLLDEWLSHAQDMVTDPPRQKLMTMALSRLLALCQPYVLGRLQQLMDLWISVIESLTEGNEDKSIDSLVRAQETILAAAEGQNAGEGRKIALTATDPVLQVNLKDVVKYAVGVVVEQCGGPDRFQQEWLVNVDKEIVEQFGKLGVV